MSMSIVWLIALVIFGVVEALTVGLASIWFAAGAAVALAASFFTDSIWIQIVLFLVVSFITLVLARPLAAKFLTPKRQATNADRVIGAEAVVTQEIDNLKGQGTVTVSGTIWTARSEHDVVISIGTHVRVLRIDGVKVMVEEE